MSSNASSAQCTCPTGAVAAADPECPYHGTNGTMVILVRVDKHKRFLGFATKPVQHG